MKISHVYEKQLFTISYLAETLEANDEKDFDKIFPIMAINYVNLYFFFDFRKWVKNKTKDFHPGSNLKGKLVSTYIILLFEEN